MSKYLTFINVDKFEEMADDFANTIYGTITGIWSQSEIYRERIPKNKKSLSRYSYRYRIDPKYIGYDGIAWEVDPLVRHAIFLLIEEKLREKFNEPNLTLEYDEKVALVYTHFLIYL